MPDSSGKFKGISVPALPWLSEEYRCPVEGHECKPPEGRACCLDYEDPGVSEDND